MHRPMAPSEHAVVVAQPHGRARAEPGTRVVVVGGGIAGLAAATVLAERGVRVTLLERERFLGGRAASWSDRLADGTEFQMERGFHAFFRQYYNLRGLLRRVDPQLGFLSATTDYPLYGPDGAAESFSDLPKRAPWNLATLVWRTPTLKLTDLPRVNGPAASEMLAYDADATYARLDDRTAEEYLDSLNFPPKARQMLFDVFAHSFFNPEDRYSAAELIAMFHFYFLGNPEGIVFDVANRPFDTALWAPLGRRLEQLGATIRTGVPVAKLEAEGAGRFVVHAEDGERLDADGVVLALSVPALQRLVARSPGVGDETWRSDVDALEVTLPFAVWRLWLDRPTAPDRASFVGTTGLGLLDNVSLFHLLEDESAEWAARTGGAIVELHAYAVPDTLDEAAIKRDLLAQLHALYPETADATILEDRFLLRRDCPAFPPGAHARRPTVETPIPGLALAGDFVRTPFPAALMEKAAATGFLAANTLLERWGVAGETVWSIPTSGVLAGLMGKKPAA
jgi:isorenieratene synthase